MKPHLKKLLKVAEKIAGVVEKRMKHELDALVKSKIISPTESRHILKAAIAEAKRERARVKAFVAAELKRELKKAKPFIKKALAKKKKQFEAYRKKRKR